MGIKAFIKKFLKDGSTAEPIHDRSDYRRVKKWVKKVRRLYIVFPILEILMLLLTLPFAKDLEMPLFGYVILLPMSVLTGWGYATLILYLPQVIKTVIRTGSMGFKVGENMETTHVNVTHEYGDTYKISSHTENKGCQFAFIAGILTFMIWVVFCVYIGPFITIKKIRDSLDNLKNYHTNETHTI